ncbi:MAG: riboflavin synthase [Leptospirillia bacterium]
MFSGIIEATGRVLAPIDVSGSAGGGRLGIGGVPFAGELAAGESVAIDGACMTVVESRGDAFFVDVSRETLRVTRMGDFKAGDRVNLERAMKLSDRLGGHLVLGHVDCLGRIDSRESVGNTAFFELFVPAPYHRYLIPKGSITVDGISLTVNHFRDLPEGSGSLVTLAIIPHTLAVTSLGDRQAGHRVHLELDMVGKYVDRFREVDGEASSGG